MRFYAFKFRPSSHSDDYTIIATYGSEEDAEKVANKISEMLRDMENRMDDYDVDWAPSDARFYSDGKRVVFTVYTAGYLSDVEALMMKVAKPQEIKYYQNYQELMIAAAVPRDLPVEAALVVQGDEEAEAIKWLIENCGKPVVADAGDRRILKWFYCGDGIFDGEELRLGGLTLNIYEHENWSVEEL